MSERPRPRYAGKAPDARAANDAVQDRLGLIVGRMGGGDEAGAEPPGGFFEEAVSRRAGRGFDAVGRRQRARLRMAHFAGHPQPAAQIDDESLVFIGVGPQMVVEVGGARRPSPPVFSAAIARNSATLSPPPETATSTVTSAQPDGGQASANLVSSGWSMEGVGSGP